MSEVVYLSRLQFAAAAMFHFLFVPLTLGLSLLVAVMETKWLRTGDEDYRRMARFWGRLFIINFALGVVTGITLEFQFGTNWARYSMFVGDVFGSLLAIEATVAFFLESTFLAVWIFGWKRLSPKMHALAIWLVAIASNLSAFWIIAANAWMQRPVGYVIRNGRAELVDFFAVVMQSATWVKFMHVEAGAFILSGFFVMGVSAWHLIRRNEVSFFKKSFRMAAYFALFFSLFEVVQGHLSGEEVARHQPAKLAAMESLWETTRSAPQILFLIPDEKNERNLAEFGKIPGLLSFLAYLDFNAEVKGLKEWPKEDRPPVLITFLAFRLMVGLGFLFPVIAFLGLVYILPETRLSRIPGGELGLKLSRLFEEHPRWLWIFVLAIPLPYIALEAGWVVAEVGRQPWLVYGLMRTSEGASSLSSSQVAVSLAGFVAVYTILGLIDFYLLARFAKRGPEPVGQREEGTADA